MGYFTCYVCQAEVPTLVTVGEPLMIQTQAMKNSGVKIVDVDLVFYDVQTQIVRLSHNLSPLDPAACHPECESERMVVTPSIVAIEDLAALDHGSTSKLAPPR